MISLSTKQAATQLLFSMCDRCMHRNCTYWLMATCTCGTKEVSRHCFLQRPAGTSEWGCLLYVSSNTQLPRPIAMQGWLSKCPATTPFSCC